MPTLYLIRGLPGAGKTTLADSIVSQHAANWNGNVEPCIKVESDQFFVSSNGHKETYNFDRRFLGAAHDEAYGKTMRYLREGKSVAVANTFSTEREVNRYLQGVERCGLKVDIKIIKCVGRFNSPHGVPRRAVEKMRSRWEDIDGEVTFNGEM